MTSARVARSLPRPQRHALQGSNRSIPIDFRDPILAYLKREIAKPTVLDGGTQPAYGLAAAIFVLDSREDPADTPLLLEYLKHPLHSAATRYDGTVGTKLRVYELRSHVRAMIEKRGAKIPPGVVYEGVVGTAKE
jgi:hypothetical protein